MGRFLFAIVVALMLGGFAGVAGADPWMGHLTVRDNAVWPEGRSGNYGTVKYFIDENANQTIPIEVTVDIWADGQPPGAVEAQVFTNLNRRDFAKVFETVGASGLSDSYFITVPMTHVGQSGNNHVFRANLDVNKAGAYRLTTRFRITGGPWLWHNDFAFDGVKQRDLAVVVSPAKARDLTLYEINTFVVEAFPGGGQAQRSTLEDFTDHDSDGFDPFNLKFVRNTLGFNGIWLMPIFPITGERHDPDSNTDVPNVSPGSPYSTRNYFAVNGLFDDTGNEGAALNELQHMVDRADNLGLDVFIDVALNHSGRDTVFGQGAVDIGVVPPSDAGLQIRNRRPSWATNNADYRAHANGPLEWAVFAPADRLGEHQWYDAGLDWYFGDYSPLGPKPGRGDVSRGGALDERDLFYTDLDPVGGYDFEVAAANYCVPMVYMGQPLGIPFKVDFQNSWQNIKSFWDGADPAVFTMYRRINNARAGSGALRSTNRWFLGKQDGGGFNNDIFSVARWQGDEVVLVFVNLRDADAGPDVFAIPDAVPLDGGPGVRYQAVNLLADNPNAPLWPVPRTAADIKANGVFVGFNFANESQYLQLRKVP